MEDDHNLVRLATEDFELEMRAKVYENDPVINNVLLWVKVRSGGFSGTMEMDVGSIGLEQFIRQMCSMNSSMKGSARIEEPYGGNHCFIEFAMDRTGHISVSGKLAVFPKGKLEFENSFDQTYLSGFIKQLCDTDLWQESL
ncbi:MAG: hypothetical protein J5685_01845 [Clostridiales bacterium]|nr:hypothetical protein [Clostridiales bacterium]